MTPFEHLLLDVLTDRAMTGFEIARAVDDRIPGSLEGREGIVYPALLSLERQDAVTIEWEVREGGRRRVYRRAEPEAPAESEFPFEEEPDGDA